MRGVCKAKGKRKRLSTVLVGKVVLIWVEVNKFGTTILLCIVSIQYRIKQVSGGVCLGAECGL